MLPSTAHRQEPILDSSADSRPLELRSLPGIVWRGTRPLEPVRRFATGVPALDALLGGGLPRGAISELTGKPSSGRSALLCTLLAAATRRGEMSALVDLPDALHPPSLEAAGADLGRVLWVRPASLRAALRCSELVVAAGGFGLVVLDLGEADLRRLPVHVWPRFAHAARRNGTVLAVLAPERVTASFAAASLALHPARVRWSKGPWRLLEGLTARLTLARNKHGGLGSLTLSYSSNAVFSSSGKSEGALFANDRMTR